MNFALLKMLATCLLIASISGILDENSFRSQHVPWIFAHVQSQVFFRHLHRICFVLTLSSQKWRFAKYWDAELCNSGALEVTQDV